MEIEKFKTDLKKVLEYILDTESDDFERYVTDGGDPEHHIYTVADRLSRKLFKE